MLLTIPVLAALALSWALAAPTANAQNASYYWESLNVLIDVQQNGDLLVQETHAYVFQRQAPAILSRYINMRRADHIDRVSVSMDGRELPVETERDGRNFVIRWSHRPINPPETLTFILRYRVHGAVAIDQGSDLKFPHDRVSWEALFGNRKRGATIERAVVTLRLPGAVPPESRRVYTSAADSRWLDARTVEFIPRENLPHYSDITVQVSFLHGLIDGPAPNWQKASWVFKKTFLTRLFPTVNWSGATDLMYWALRFFVFAFIALLFVASRIRKHRWPEGHYPPEPQGLAEFPSDLPAPVASVLETREVGPLTYLSILVDLLQKGNLTMTGEIGNEGRTHSLITLDKQSDPNLPWERIVYARLNPRSTNSEDLKNNLEWEEKDAIRDRLDEYLVSRGIFNDPPLRVRAEQQMGCVVFIMWLLAAIIVGLGLGLWVNLFFSPWWAGTAVGVLAALVFGVIATDSPAGRIIPTESGALEISRWRGFRTSLRDGHANPDLDPDQNDPFLSYAVALNSADRWINDIMTLPPWFRLAAVEEQTAQNRQRAYLGFIGADSWALDGGPKIKANLPSRGGGGGGGDVGGG